MFQDAKIVTPTGTSSVQAVPAPRPATPWWLYAASIGVPTAAVLLATFGFGVPPRAILGDAATYVGQPPYLGLFSNLGVLGW